ncbi:MAG: hypothetical protein WC795_01505 [Candidatus Paceibacterota bacterium]|jgi:hypothetical protein
MKNNLIQNLKILSLALVIGLGVHSLSAFGTNPSSIPPTVNVPAPINTSAENQQISTNGGSSSSLLNVDGMLSTSTLGDFGDATLAAESGNVTIRPAGGGGGSTMLTVQGSAYARLSTSTNTLVATSCIFNQGQTGTPTICADATGQLLLCDAPATSC